MNLNKLDRKSLIALAMNKGIRWPSRIKSDELIRLISIAEENVIEARDDNNGDSSVKGKNSKGTFITDNDNDGGLMPGSSSFNKIRDPDYDNQLPVYDAEVVVHDQLDTVDLIGIENQEVLARLPLQGLIGRGRSIKIHEIRLIGRRKGLNIRPGFTLQL